MYPNDFEYRAPASLNEALQLLREGQSGGEVKVLAGGQSLIPLIKLRLAEPATLIDLGKIAELRGVREEGNGLVIGAMTTYFQTIDDPTVQRRCPLLAQTIRQVGDPQVRARGTIGGSLAHADPAGDLPAAAMALDAEVRVAGPSGQRSIPVRSFITDTLTTELQPDEIVTAVSFQATDTPHTGTAYAKHRHPASGYAVVGVAAVIRLGADGACQEARIGLTGAGSHATRASSVEQELTGKQLDANSIAQACQSIADGLDMMSDSYASAEYRAHLARVMARRAIEQALASAKG